MGDDAARRRLVDHFFAAPVVIHDRAHFAVHRTRDGGWNVAFSKRIYHARSKLLETEENLVVGQEQTFQISRVERRRELA